jgi:peptidoglycan hydrolase-like protein with peptidoglycan-binding domain
MAARGVAMTLVAVLVLAACGSDGADSVETAQARVKSKQRALADAQAAFDEASADFCQDSESYITALDSYGKVFDDSAATVGDVKSAGADLTAPRAAASSSAQAVGNAADELTIAREELADAEADLAAAQSGSTTPAPPPTSPSTTTLVPAATVDRVRQAESDLEAAGNGITDETPLARATAEYNSAALALEVAWLRLFADAGCLTDEQQAKAAQALTDYTVALQNALVASGYYDGRVDGVYGPATVEAVKQLQTDKGLPATGYVDRATAAALDAALASKGGAVASSALAHTAAVQSTLKLAGYWTGPVDGRWTPELTDALKKFQTDLGVPATGAVDIATLSALETTIAEAQAPPPPPTSTTSPVTTSTKAP